MESPVTDRIAVGDAFQYIYLGRQTELPPSLFEGECECLLSFGVPAWPTRVRPQVATPVQLVGHWQHDILAVRKVLQVEKWWELPLRMVEVLATFGTALPSEPPPVVLFLSTSYLSNVSGEGPSIDAHDKTWTKLGLTRLRALSRAVPAGRGILVLVAGAPELAADLRTYEAGVDLALTTVEGITAAAARSSISTCLRVAQRSRLRGRRSLRSAWFFFVAAFSLVPLFTAVINRVVDVLWSAGGEFCGTLGLGEMLITGLLFGLVAPLLFVGTLAIRSALEDEFWEGTKYRLDQNRRYIWGAAVLGVVIVFIILVCARYEHRSQKDSAHPRTSSEVQPDSTTQQTGSVDQDLEQARAGAARTFGPSSSPAVSPRAKDGSKCRTVKALPELDPK